MGKMNYQVCICGKINNQDAALVANSLLEHGPLVEDVRPGRRGHCDG